MILSKILRGGRCPAIAKGDLNSPSSRMLPHQPFMNTLAHEVRRMNELSLSGERRFPSCRPFFAMYVGGGLHCVVDKPISSNRLKRSPRHDCVIPLRRGVRKYFTLKTYSIARKRMDYFSHEQKECWISLHLYLSSTFLTKCFSSLMHSKILKEKTLTTFASSHF